MTCSQHKQCASHGNLDRMCAPTCVKACKPRKTVLPQVEERIPKRKAAWEKRKKCSSVHGKLFCTVPLRLRHQHCGQKQQEAERFQRLKDFMLNPCFFGPTATPSQKAQSRSLARKQFAVGDVGVSPATWATSGLANVAYRQYFVPDSTGRRVQHAGIGPKVEFHQVRGRQDTSKGEGFFANGTLQKHRGNW